MAIAFDNKAVLPLEGRPLTNSLTMTAGANAVMLAYIFSSTARESASAVTYNSVPLTFLGAVERSTTNRMEVWGLTAPDAGANTFQVTMSTTGFMGLIVVTYTGAAGSNPFGTVVVGTAASTTVANLSISATADGIVSCAFAINATGTLTPQDWTSRGTNSTTIAVLVGDALGGSVVSLSTSAAASTNWFMMGLPIFESTGAAPSPSPVPSLSLLGAGF
jgi:hypothetical protein